MFHTNETQRKERNTNIRLLHIMIFADETLAGPKNTAITVFMYI